MADLTVKQGDYGFNWTFTVQNSDASVFDLTGYTINMKTWSLASPPVLLLSDTCTIIGATSGTCRYTVGSTDYCASGKYNVELEMTAAGIVQSTNTYTLEVMESA